MAVTASEARAQILDDLAAAAEQVGLAGACLGEAYEQLDQNTADRLEDDLFRPVQRAYGRAKRTRTQFAERFELVAGPLESPSPGRVGNVKALVDRAVAASADADRRIAELQDSMLPIEAGDSELRAGLAETRDLLDGLSARARALTRTLGR